MENKGVIIVPACAWLCGVIDLKKLKNINKINNTCNSKMDNLMQQLEANHRNVRGLCGLRNIGNTCYMNCVLQCLASSNILVPVLLSVSIPDDRTLTHHLSEVIKTIWRENGTIIPLTFKKAIGTHNDMFNGNQQNDCQELLNLILDKIHEESKKQVIVEYTNMPLQIIEFDATKRVFVQNMENATEYDKNLLRNMYQQFKDANIVNRIIHKGYIKWKMFVEKSFSFVTKHFTGLLYSKLTCQTCNNIISRFEPFTVLSLQIPEKGVSTLEDCLVEYTKDESLTEDNKYYCKKCNCKSNCKKRMHIWESPDILIIHLKRFNGDKKTKTTIKFPINGFDIGMAQCELHMGNKTVYDCWAVCKHMGLAHFGHYTACCKNLINGKWYEFNDEVVNFIPDEQVENELVDDAAYVLFYVKRM